MMLLWWGGYCACEYCPPPLLPQGPPGRRRYICPKRHICRDLTNPELASKFLTQKPNIEGYYRHETVTVAPKTTVAPGSMLGRGSRLGERCTVKRR